MMKAKMISIGVLLSITAVLLTFHSCKKPEDKFFNGNYHIRGAVFFQNQLTNTIDSAAGAQLTIYKQGADTSVNYSAQLVKGSYDISNLSGGTLTINIKFVYRYPGAVKSTSYSLITTFTLKQEFQDQVNFTLLQDTTATPTLRLIISGPNNLPGANAQVALYADTISLLANQFTGAGSLRTGVANAAGLVLFDNLQLNKKYFLSAYNAQGTDTIANYASYTQQLTVSQAIQFNTDTVKLTQPVAPALVFLIKDQYNAIIPKAQVYLYSDTTLLDKYKSAGTGSLRSAVSNTNGLVTFPRLQQLNYYISAYLAYGTDTLNNQGTYRMPYMPMAQNLATPVVVHLIKK